MALPSSGEISIADIRTEVSSVSGSLRTLSNLAGKSSPDAMSEFHGYSHLVAFSSSSSSTFSQVCPFNGSSPSLNQTYYHNGVAGDPTAGDTCYSNASGTNTLGQGYYYIGGTGSGNRKYIELNSSGVVNFAGVQTC